MSYRWEKKNRTVLVKTVCVYMRVVYVWFMWQVRLGTRGELHRPDPCWPPFDLPRYTWSCPVHVKMEKCIHLSCNPIPEREGCKMILSFWTLVRPWSQTVPPLTPKAAAFVLGPCVFAPSPLSLSNTNPSLYRGLCFKIKNIHLQAKHQELCFLGNLCREREFKMMGNIHSDQVHIYAPPHS